MSSNSSEPRWSYSHRLGSVFCRCDRPASTSARKASCWPSFDSTRSSISNVSRESQPRELPPCIGGEEIPVARAHVIGRRRARPAAQNELSGHELAVVFADCAFRRLEARVGGKGAARPLPHIAVDLTQARLPSLRRRRTQAT